MNNNSNEVNQAVDKPTLQQPTPAATDSNATSSTLAPTEIDKKFTKKKAKKDKGKENGRIKSFRYTVLNSAGKKERGSLDTETIDEARNFLITQDYKILELKPRSPYDIDLGSSKFKASDLSFTLTQLSTYIKSGIPLADSVRILAKQSTNPAHKKIFSQLVYELLRGENLSSAMEKQKKVFPELLINMVKTAELTGDLPSILDDMSDYYTSMAQTRKQMISAMTYPSVVLLIAFAVLIFMLTYLVPQFTELYASNDAEIPKLTLAIVSVSTFLKTNYLILIGVIIILIILFILAYKKIQKFRKGVQIVLMHLPIISKVIIYNEIANFTRTFASLLNHGVFITDSMEILSKITNNEVYKEIISSTLVNLAKGDSVSTAFRGKWAVPVVAYEMIVTGESTGRLGEMMDKVASHFQSLHKSIIDQMKSLIEPLMICVLAIIVGVILLAVIQPMFGIYDTIK